MSSATSSPSKFSHLLPPSAFTHLVSQWLHEDAPRHDVGGFVVGDELQTASLFCKASGVLAGVPFAEAVMKEAGLTCEWLIPEGEYIEINSGDKKKRVLVARVSGPCRNLLLAERTLLNVLARASGVATQASRAVSIARSYNWDGCVAGTRKTTPGFGMVEKYALIVGGVDTHRMDLSHMVMLKDNHIWSVGSISQAVLKAKSVAGFSTKIEVECQSVEEAIEAAEAGADIVMLDNFAGESLGSAAEQVKAQFPNVLIEASGGITEETMHEYMFPCVDIISRGSLTQGYPTIDFSLKIDQKQPVVAPSEPKEDLLLPSLSQDEELGNSASDPRKRDSVDGFPLY